MESVDNQESGDFVGDTVEKVSSVSLFFSESSTFFFIFYMDLPIGCWFSTIIFPCFLLL